MPSVIILLPSFQSALRSVGQRRHKINSKQHSHNEPAGIEVCICISGSASHIQPSWKLKLLPLCGMRILHSLRQKYPKIAALKQSGGQSGCLEKSLETVEATAVLLYCAHKGKASCGYLGGLSRLWRRASVRWQHKKLASLVLKSCILFRDCLEGGQRFHK